MDDYKQYSLFNNENKNSFEKDHLNIDYIKNYFNEEERKIALGFKQLQPKTFDWKNPSMHGDKTQQLGFLAQDMESVDTRFIGETTLSENSLDLNLVDADTISKTSKFGPKDAMYISVIQQLITRIEALENA